MSQFDKAIPIGVVSLYGNFFTVYEEEVLGNEDCAVYTVCRNDKYDQAIFKFQDKKDKMVSVLDTASDLIKWSSGEYSGLYNKKGTIPEHFFMNSYISSRTPKKSGTTVIQEFLMVDYDDTLKIFTGCAFANYPITPLLISKLGNDIASFSLVKCFFSDRDYTKLLLKGKHVIDNAASFLQNYVDTVDITYILEGGDIIKCAFEGCETNE